MLTLRDHQNQAVASAFNYFYAGFTGNPLIAMPTATGKSLVIGEFIRQTLMNWPYTRILSLTHVKELIEQNSDKLSMLWPEAPFGIYSAGLNQKDTAHPVIFGGIASVVNNLNAFGHRDLIMVDEAHLIGPKADTLYQQTIKHFRTINPKLKVIGLTATPYRLGQGMLTDSGLFTDICCDQTSIEWFEYFFSQGYLVPPIPRMTETEIDVSKVKIQNGDFKKDDLQKAVDHDSITYSACMEMCRWGMDRKSWIVFASGVEHSEHVARTLNSMGIDAEPVHSKMPQNDADDRIQAFRDNRLRVIVNYGKLTTGFDHKPIDMIGMLRPTMSTSLWVQMVGRGMRPYPNKLNCLVLDFAGNTKRLGPINDPIVPRRRGKGKPGDAPVKICPNCNCYNHLRATVCIMCGATFDIMPKIAPVASTAELIRTSQPQIEMHNVDTVIYHRHEKKGSPPMMRVSYLCGLRKFDEYICLEHPGFAGKKARDWWKERMQVKVAPPSIAEAMKYIQQLKKPKQIRVLNAQYPEVLGYVY
jgi:DNA repair protein RadD